MIAFLATAGLATVVNFCDNSKVQRDLTFFSAYFRENIGATNALEDLLLNSKGGYCRVAVEKYFETVKSEEVSAKNFGDRAWYLRLAITAQINSLPQIIGDEIEKGNAIEYLKLWQEVDKERYLFFMNSWSFTQEAKFRSLFGAEKIAIKDYGREKENAKFKPESIEHLGLVISLYGEALLEQNSSDKNDLGRFFFFLSLLSHRFQSANESTWLALLDRHGDKIIEAFRAEPIEIKVRLIPFLEKGGKGGAATELLWISNNHNNINLKARAEAALRVLLQLD